ncbi:XkdX family protein [Weissella oryzae]|nr:XkdX family protein [Weissella oryzae]
MFQQIKEWYEKNWITTDKVAFYHQAGLLTDEQYKSIIE